MNRCLAVPGFRRLGRCQLRSSRNNRQKATQRGRFAAMDNTRIAMQESLNGGFIHLMQVELLDRAASY